VSLKLVLRELAKEKKAVKNPSHKLVAEKKE
jgi:hypothetical protein